MRAEAIDVDKIETLSDAIAVIKILLKENAELRAENAELKERVARLEKNSQTSSKPPSSDITKPPNERRRPGERKIGGQAGHKRHIRELVPTDKVEVKDLQIEQCPDCGSAELNPETTTSVRIQQVAELRPDPVEVIEHHSHGRYCPCCGEVKYPSLPEGVIPGQLLGARLLSLLGYMKAGMGVSITELQQYCQNVLGINLSQGLISKAIMRVSEALKPSYDELQQNIPQQPSLNIDETTWRNSGKKPWVWVFCSEVLAFFAIRASRGCVVLKEILGETFSGAITSDFYSAYVCFANLKQQFCLAHLIRDIKFLTTLPDAATKYFGRRVLRYFRAFFELWHKRQLYQPEVLHMKVDRLQRKLYTFLHSANVPGDSKEVLKLKKRLVKHWDSLFRFFAEPELFEPTNNRAERMLRRLVRLRLITQGSRGSNGELWTARAMTALETCKLQGRNTWHFFQQAVIAHFFNKPAPSLLPLS